jgi:hypothetical protein
MRIIKKSLMVYLFHIRKKKVKRIAEIIFLNVKKYIKKALKKLFIVNYIKLCVKQKKSKNCDNNLYNKINNLPHGITGLEYFKKINSVIQEYRDDLPKLT